MRHTFKCPRGVAASVFSVLFVSILAVAHNFTKLHLEKSNIYIIIIYYRDLRIVTWLSLGL